MRKVTRTLCVAWALSCAHGEGANGPAKKLIEFGWDEPGTSFMRNNIVQMQRSPFDGCVFHVDYQRASRAEGSFTWQAWGTNRFTRQDLQAAFDDLRATRFGKFRWNFLRFNTTPGRIDWFDDFSAVIGNARLAAELARAGKCPGLLFDIEQYDGELFNYRKQRDAERKSWELYAAQARARGKEVMSAFQEGYPGLIVFLTFGYSLPWAQTEGGRKALADCGYGLLAPFLDGLVAAARPGARLVDGFELSYGYKQAEQFAAARKMFEQDLLPIVDEPEAYKKGFSLSFGLWMDHDWRKTAWNTEDFSKNHFSPDQLAITVHAALAVADEFVWIYSETPRWWTIEGTTARLPAAYDAALRKARAMR